jgi:hypothetical protein
MKTYKLIIDDSVLDRYAQFYFENHPKAHKKPIPHPYHESINVWMIMRRPLMNALKQRWKDFIKWFVASRGYTSLAIKKCEIYQTVYYPNNRRHDPDNSVPKFILDGLVESGMLEDDDSKHITKLVLECMVDTEYPRTEIVIKVKPEEKEKIEYGKKVKSKTKHD